MHINILLLIRCPVFTPPTTYVRDEVLIISYTIPLIQIFVVMVVMALVVFYAPHYLHALETCKLVSAAKNLVLVVGSVVVAVIVAVAAMVAVFEDYPVKRQRHACLIIKNIIIHKAAVC